MILDIDDIIFDKATVRDEFNVGGYLINHVQSLFGEIKDFKFLLGPTQVLQQPS
jgi:hypothetical protein